MPRNPNKGILLVTFGGLFGGSLDSPVVNIINSTNGRQHSTYINVPLVSGKRLVISLPGSFVGWSGLGQLCRLLR